MKKQFIAEDELTILDAPEEVLSTLTKDGKRRWLYPTPSKGRYWTARVVVGWLLIALFVALPIVPINGKPAVLLDLATREFTLFGTTFYPTDTFLLLLLGIGGLLFIILITALLGRVWCGWGCPQTVYLELVFRPIERWIEGKEHVRKRRDEGPWSWDKAWRKSAKWSLYGLISLALAHTFVAYFVGWDRLLLWMQSPPAEHWGYFVLMAGTTGLILYDFGIFREQMCTITCPYARFQSVLLDPDSLIVSYDVERGEPRGRGKDRSDLGDCIDCYACVRTCPTGIDIRDGLQMECIACTQCIDACDDIMDKVGFEPGLIRYTSERALDGGTTRRLRPRVVLYSALLLFVTALFTYNLTTRADYRVGVGRAQGAPFMELPGDQIANRLRFRVRNQTGEPTQFTLHALSPQGATLNVVGTPTTSLDAQAFKHIEAWVIVPESAFAAGSAEGRFQLRFDDGTTRELTFNLLGPSS